MCSWWYLSPKLENSNCPDDPVLLWINPFVNSLYSCPSVRQKSHIKHCSLFLDSSMETTGKLLEHLQPPNRTQFLLRNWKNLVSTNRHKFWKPWHWYLNFKCTLLWALIPGTAFLVFLRTDPCFERDTKLQWCASRDDIEQLTVCSPIFIRIPSRVSILSFKCLRLQCYRTLCHRAFRMPAVSKWIGRHKIMEYAKVSSKRYSNLSSECKI